MQDLIEKPNESSIRYSYQDSLPSHDFRVKSENILKVLSKHNYLLTKKSLTELFLADFAHFDSDTIRVVKNGSYELIDENFQETFNPSSHTDFTFMLSSHKVPIDLINMQLQIDGLKSDMDKLRKYIESMNKNTFQQKVPKFAEIVSGLAKKPNNGIDLALMYAEPLVKKLGSHFIDIGDPVDFEDECRNLMKSLQAKERAINVSFEVGNTQNLVRIISKNPAILHLICHGDYSKEHKQFYLCFEEDGILKQLLTSELKSLLDKSTAKIKLVFVNACHSEEIGKIFLKAGIPCVIAVQSHLKIADTVAQKFSEVFYDYLFDGKTIQEAFDFAMKVPVQDYMTCCCAHEHEDNCKWFEERKKEGWSVAHEKHSPNCSCIDKMRGIHSFTCVWKNKFMEDYNEEAFDYPCCCKPDLNHSENLKFKLLTINNEKERANIKIFEEKKTGILRIFNKANHSCLDLRFPVTRVSGVNEVLHELYRKKACI